MEWDDITLGDYVMVGLRMRKRRIRGDGGNHHAKVRLQRILCASQSTFPDMAGMSPDQAGYKPDTTSYNPNQASCTTDFSEWLISAGILHIVPIFIPHLSFSSITLPSSRNTKLTTSQRIYQCSPIRIGYISLSKLVDEGNHVHDDSLEYYRLMRSTPWLKTFGNYTLMVMIISRQYLILLLVYLLYINCLVVCLLL